MEHWSERLRRVLRSRGWSYTELAHRSGVSREGIKKYVKGIVEKPRGRVVDRLAKALLVPTAWLRDGKPDLEPEISREAQRNLDRSLVRGAASVLFPVRSSTPSGRDTRAAGQLGGDHPRQEPSRPPQEYEAAGATSFPTSHKGPSHDPSRSYSKRGRPRKTPQSNYYSLSPSVIFRRGADAEHQGGYPSPANTPARKGSAGEPSHSQSAPDAGAPAAGVVAPQATGISALLDFDAPEVRAQQQADRYAVPVYDIATLTRPLDIGRAEPLYWQMFDARFLSSPARFSPTSLFIAVITDDCMRPTLQHGDRIIVDSSVQTVGTDGIYVLHWAGGMVIKRLCVNPATHLVHVVSDNQRYTSYDSIQPNEIHIVGRLIWLSRFI